MELKIKRLSEAATIPRYQTSGAACFDLHASEHVWGKGPTLTVRTGISVEIPDGYVMLIYSRSGHGFKHGIRLVNSVGVIDSDYRGEIQVGLRLDGVDWFDVKVGDRIAQAMLMPVEQAQIVEADELTATERGSGGFGSTGR